MFSYINYFDLCLDCINTTNTVTPMRPKHEIVNARTAKGMFDLREKHDSYLFSIQQDGNELETKIIQKILKIQIK
jgi:hypothetical protein